jgi:YggT family protein
VFVLTNFLLAVAEIVNAILSIYWWIVIAAAVLSWVNPDPYNPIVRFLRAATEPVMARIRRVIPLFFGGIDFTPIVVLLLIQFLQMFLVPTLRQIAVRMGGQPSTPFLM